MVVLPFNRKSARGWQDDRLDQIAAEYQQANLLVSLPQRLYEEICLMCDIREQDLSELTEEEYTNCKKMIDDVLTRQFRSGVIKQQVELSR